MYVTSTCTMILCMRRVDRDHPEQPLILPFSILRLEPAATDPEGTVVVEIPVDAGAGLRTAKDLSMWEQLSFAAFLQRYWADNQVTYGVACSTADGRWYNGT